MDTAPIIVASELERRLPDPKLCILDCRFDLMDTTRGKAAWLDSHIPGAVYADLDNDLSAAVSSSSGRHPLPDADVAVATFRRLGIGSDGCVVVYDADNGSIAARAWWMLHWLGHERVALLDRGFAGWLADGRPLESGRRAVAPGDFRGTSRDELILTTDEIVRSLDENGEIRLVDARAAARFRGEIEPIDVAAGHIPGAVNLPFTENLRADGGWKSAAELHELWQRTLPPSACERGVMCGSGVTACHLVISARLAGIREPRLYAGSWSEWIRHPDRPRAGAV